MEAPKRLHVSGRGLGGFRRPTLDLTNGRNLSVGHGAPDGTATLYFCLLLLFLPLQQQRSYFLLLASSISSGRVCLPGNPVLGLSNPTVTFSLPHFD